MRLSLRGRLLSILIPGAVALWLLSAVLSYVDTRGEVEDLLDTQLLSSARVLLAISEHEIVEQHAFDAGENGSVIPTTDWSLGHPYEKQVAFQIWLNNTNLVVRSENAPLTPISKSLNGFSEVSFNQQNWRVLSLQSNDGNLRVHIGEQSDLRHELTNAVVFRMVVPMLVGLPFLALILWFGIGQSMAPLQRIAREMNQRNPNDLHAVDEDAVPLEARPLTNAINRLFEHMKSAFDSERRFTSDAAHELRTPLAALKTHAEVALQAKETVQQQQALRQVVRGVNRATRLVEQLLTLARLDPESGLKDVRRLDLFIVAEAVISDEAPLALEKNIEISLTGTRGKFVNGNQDAISVLTRNLVDNAIRYTPDGGEVEISINRDEESNTVILSVGDSGAGIPEEDRQRIFQRFYRRLGTKPSGSGLGLSIVSRIADLHQAKIELQTARLGGLSVEVQFVAAERRKREREDNSPRLKIVNA